MNELAGRVLADYVRWTDELAPGVIDGIYVVGSLALDDFHEDTSDIDFVGVLHADPSPEQLAALASVHGKVTAGWRRPYLDGVYLTPADLAAGPRVGTPRPAVHMHEFTAASTFAQDQITWHTLARHGVTVAGVPAGELGIRTDRHELIDWVRGNVADYWRPWVGRYGSLRGLGALGDWPTAWGVLGISRMSYTVATGEITSKRGAGEYALQKTGILAAHPERMPADPPR